MDTDDDSEYIDGVFFQAEDGIRDLVRSRGLGDVYKRQVYTLRELRSRRWRGNDEETVLRQYAQRVVIVVLQLSLIHI